ncbi:methylenetetrahydrofolate reductase [Microbacterium sp. EYE_5]|uniref:methylenetetrahydrofolate reductase n=1 Tax=unclassified Microbacterium TaxID=2609290 RepID=UPI0020038335|nr:MULTISPECIES: methylenetetrahydrofolate reductase [unclassified Microbacterium]MCK6081870.1 methylenetetrahydrofolate reductase [Microbacterium sp. EYE_382]MCK6087140.1 methylenetetrahydrofolate reductase [Microbacterium sp. EYE_384]MCK6124882.1 methylenetetrahydrofolate reductase [Microbacterium sp. EYE_80]MCK6127903.1 methylenetetrahydrofolate reductase [Microbacterium sp. EYE_79]MCK6142824.1 methylenetetrahydrofolate reductase [Microbacterium sp. EYE_39]
MSIITTPSVTTVPVSFEVYPPRSDASYAALYETIARLAEVAPSFISVTYGAGGSTGGRSLDVLTHILRETRVEPLAHLTCIGSSYAEATALIREFLAAGIRSFLALRGDPPEGAAPGETALGDLESAAQLVQLIDRVQAEHSPYREDPIPGVPGAARVGRRQQVDIAVAAFPNGHPRSRYPSEHIDALLAKQAAGATLAITQLFFHADDYLAFVGRARQAGVLIPILPGIMPITSPGRLRRVLELTGEQVPGDLAVELDVEPTAEGRRELGIRYAAELSRAVLEGGAPGIHLYAFNNHDTVLATLREAGIIASTKETAP